MSRSSSGWGVLAHRPGRELVIGAVARPWMPNVTFTPIVPERFATFSEPDVVKIIWTLEAERRYRAPGEPRTD